MPEGPVDLSVVIPCLDEERRLPESLATVVPYLESRPGTFELILVDDGSLDGTLALMRELANSDRRIRVVAHQPNLGKGRSLADGVAVSRGRLVLVSDADFSTPIGELPKLEARIRAGAGVAIASRATRGSRVEVSQPVYRVLMGKTFNLMVQAVLLPGLWDTQCGFKLFRGELGRRLFAELKTNGFGYDVEVLYRARRQGERIDEVAVSWYNSAPTKVAALRHSLEMFTDIFRIRFGV